MFKQFVMLMFVLPIFGSTVCGDEPAPEARAPELQTGDALPEFDLIDDQGRDWKLAEHIGGKVMVLYFYPGDFTSGCTAQAQKFRDSLKELAGLGIEVVGISGDKPDSHKLFKETHGLEHALLSDPEGRVARQLGVAVGPPGKARAIGADRQPITGPDGKSIFIERAVTLERWTFIVSAEGKVLSQRKVVNPVTDAAEVLEIVKKLP